MSIMKEAYEAWGNSDKERFMNQICKMFGYKDWNNIPTSTIDESLYQESRLHDLFCICANVSELSFPYSDQDIKQIVQTLDAVDEYSRLNSIGTKDLEYEIVIKYSQFSAVFIAWT
jgi:hypothetical protein